MPADTLSCSALPIDACAASLLIVARDDKLTVADLALAAYEGALEPKRLALMPGGHFDPYLDQFPLAEAAATQWFREHLLNHGASHP
jgi:uncharacterized protein